MIEVSVSSTMKRRDCVIFYLDVRIRGARVRHRYHGNRHPNPEAVSDGHSQEEQQHLQVPDPEDTCEDRPFISITSRLMLSSKFG